MKRLLLLDGKNYDDSMPEINRVSVRGIAFLDGRLIFAEESSGFLKLPGGGQDEGETDLETLVREFKEETGCSVIPESVREFGYIEEKRRSLHEDMIWHQFNHLYFCEVDGTQGDCDYSDNEKNRGMHPALWTLEEALAKNLKVLEEEGKQAWNQREYNTLLLIKEYLDKE